MEFMDIPDISFIDIAELGVRPRNWIAEDNDVDFDGPSAHDQLERKGLDEYSKLFMTSADDEVGSITDENDCHYEIDPETGEKIFCEVPVASAPLSNDTWITEYLSSIPSKARDFFFDDIPGPGDFNWLGNFRPRDESTNPMMFTDQLLAGGEYLPKTDKQVTSSIYIPASNRNTMMNLFSVSIEDEHSRSSSSSHSNERQRFLPSLESDSPTHDSELTFDGSFVETKLEKLEHDEHVIPQMFIRRSSVRSSCQGQHDDDALRRANIPLTLYDITQSNTEEYNRHLARLNYLNAEQMHIIKDIRRRGKNKIAAQNCRKRKVSNVETLTEEVNELKRVKYELEELKKNYHQQIHDTRHQYEYLHRQVLPDRQLLPEIIVK